MGFPIRRSPDQSLLNDSPELIAAGRVLHRLPAPRHPPYALSNLTIKFSQDKKAASSIVKELIYPSVTPPGGHGFRSNVVAIALCHCEERSDEATSTEIAAPLSEARNNPKNMVELTGIEPATSGVQNRRSPN